MACGSRWVPRPDVGWTVRRGGPVGLIERWPGVGHSIARLGRPGARRPPGAGGINRGTVVRGVLRDRRCPFRAASVRRLLHGFYWNRARLTRRAPVGDRRDTGRAEHGRAPRWMNPLAVDGRYPAGAAGGPTRSAVPARWLPGGCPESFAAWAATQQLAADYRCRAATSVGQPPWHTGSGLSWCHIRS